MTDWQNFNNQKQTIIVTDIITEKNLFINIVAFLLFFTL